MPILDGFGFLEAFNWLSIANKESVRIIILTSSIDPGDVKKVKALGVKLYLTKPIFSGKADSCLAGILVSGYVSENTLLVFN